MVDLSIYSNQKTMIFHRFFINHHKSHHKPNIVNFPWKTRFVQTPVGAGGHPQQRRKASKGPMAPGRSASHPVCSNGPLLAPSDPSWATNRATRGTQAWWSLVGTWVYLAEVCKRLLGSIPRKCWFEWENIMEIYDIYIYIGLNFYKASTCDDTGMMVYI